MDNLIYLIGLFIVIALFWFIKKEKEPKTATEHVQKTEVSKSESNKPEEPAVIAENRSNNHIEHGSGPSLPDKYQEWKIIKQIGQGSLGTVYEIEQHLPFDLTTKSALKIISFPKSDKELSSLWDKGFSSEEIKEYYRNVTQSSVNEIAFMVRFAGLTNFVNCQDYHIQEHADGIGYDIMMRMELLTPLNQFIQENNLSKKDIIKLGIDICSALEICQRYGVVHGDIKPGNLFVSTDGDYKLGDFGTAKMKNEIFAGKSRRGTYDYMAPEVYRNEAVDYRCDIFSLGIVLYRLLNQGRFPFMSPDNEEKITDEQYALNLRMRGEKIPYPCNDHSRLAEIVLKACEFDCNDRYASAKAMKMDLERLLPVIDEHQEVISTAEEDDYWRGDWKVTAISMLVFSDVNSLRVNMAQRRIATIEENHFQSTIHPSYDNWGVIERTDTPNLLFEEDNSIPEDSNHEHLLRIIFDDKEESRSEAPYLTDNSDHYDTENSGSLVSSVDSGSPSEELGSFCDEPNVSYSLPNLPFPIHSIDFSIGKHGKPRLQEDSLTHDGRGHLTASPAVSPIDNSIQIDKVQFRIAAPKKLKPGSTELLKLVMFLEERWQEADRMIQELGKKTKSNSSSVTEAKRGELVQVYLQSPDAVLTDSYTEFVWKGNTVAHDFELSLPSDYQKEKILIKARVCQGDAILTDLKLILKVKAAKEQIVAAERCKYQTAFASYAHEDKEAVLGRIQGIQAASTVDMFFDDYTLRQGDNWEEKIYYHIDTSDIFYLFWSHYAQNSKWVSKELHYALERKGEDYIHPVPLEAPERCKPPKELEKRHFSHWTLYYEAGLKEYRRSANSSLSFF